jgi:hypothetical protein
MALLVISNRLEVSKLAVSNRLAVSNKVCSLLYSILFFLFANHILRSKRTTSTTSPSIPLLQSRKEYQPSYTKLEQSTMEWITIPRIPERYLRAPFLFA